MKKILCTLFVLFLILASFAAWNVFQNRTFEETFYTIYSDKIETPVRAVLITDLHQTAYGKENEDLIHRIEKLEPDLILMGGDIVNKDGTDISFAVELCRKLLETAPVYYSLGNHENEAVYGADLTNTALEKKKALLGDNPEDFSPLEKDSRLLDELEELGVIVLQNSSVSVEINGNPIDIGGISTGQDSFWPYSGKFVSKFLSEDTSVFKLLMSHRPEPVMRYIPDYEIDLVVSGHNHGGQVRIPGIGGLYSMEEGFFPELDSGLRETSSLTMIISRGLGNHGVIPRICNKPELVVIDIN